MKEPTNRLRVTQPGRKCISMSKHENNNFDNHVQRFTTEGTSTGYIVSRNWGSALCTTLVPGALDATLSLNLSLSPGWGLLLVTVLEDLVLRSELSNESGDGVVKFLRREDPIFRSATVMGREPAWVSAAWTNVDALMDPTHFHRPQRSGILQVSLVTRYWQTQIHDRNGSTVSIS